MKIAPNSVNDEKLSAGAVTTPKIANGAVTAEKLAPGVGGGSRITFLPTRIQLTSLIVTGNQDWIPTASNPSIPDDAVALILQVELINNLNGAFGFINLRIRQDAAQAGALALGIDSTYPGMVVGAQATVPIVAGSFQYAFTDMYGTVSVTFNPYVIGYII